MSDWMTPEQVAQVTGISAANLKKMRYERRGIPFYKPTLKTVLYDRGEVDRYIKSQRVTVRAA